VGRPGASPNGLIPGCPWGGGCPTGRLSGEERRSTGSGIRPSKQPSHRLASLASATVPWKPFFRAHRMHLCCSRASGQRRRRGFPKPQTQIHTFVPTWRPPARTALFSTRCAQLSNPRFACARGRRCPEPGYGGLGRPDGREVYRPGPLPAHPAVPRTAEQGTPSAG
jgi:hypothetical protein